MFALFISHSSQDDSIADRLKQWLDKNGFTDTFFDHHSLTGGTKWPDALRDAAGACRVVACIVTKNWLSSLECFSEFGAAWYMGKRILPIVLLPSRDQLSEDAKSRLDRVLAEDQGVDLWPCYGADGVLDIEHDPMVANRLRVGLRAGGALAEVGLDPEAFEIDTSQRPTPFPGLAAFGDDDADAAIFYGRSREISQTLEALRSMRALGERRPLVILGSSGSGKSSLLNAGIIPRLRREAPAWLPMRSFRPGADPLLNFAESMARTLADYGKAEAHGSIRDRLLVSWRGAQRDAAGRLTDAGLAALSERIEQEGAALRAAAGRKVASILISVDQAEELTRTVPAVVQPAGDGPGGLGASLRGESGLALADYLRVAIASQSSNWQLALTIRTDSFPELQTHPCFRDLEARGYDLRPLPVFQFDSVVEEPAKRYRVNVKVELVHALMQDAPEEDALPLLAFALQRLWNLYHKTGSLTEEHYNSLGRLRGLIEDAAERALRGIEPTQDVPLEPGLLGPDLDRLGASVFLPHLVQLNANGAPIKQAARWQDFTREQQDLLTRCNRWRLVVFKNTEDSRTVEVTHEALFREWSRLKAWLEPERARLEVLRLLRLAANIWQRNGCSETFLDHRGPRLDQALELANNSWYRGHIGDPEAQYLQACRSAQDAMRASRRRTALLIGLLAVLLSTGAGGWWNQGWIRETIDWHTRIAPYIAARIAPHVLSADRERQLARGDRFRECDSLCPEMVVIPPGEFMMGSAPSSPKGLPSERPMHVVRFDKAFALAVSEVTIAEWGECVSYGWCPAATVQGGGSHPVTGISRADALTYTAWLSKVTGRPYRLPSEAEWEYAARGLTALAQPAKDYHWGDEASHSFANYGKNICCEGAVEGADRWLQTAPVRSFPPNAFGLHDMHGNVAEWTADDWHDSYDGSPPSDGSAWGGGVSEQGVVRGGAWNNNPRLLRSAGRTRAAASRQAADIGFRVARTLGPKD